MKESSFFLVHVKPVRLCNNMCSFHILTSLGAVCGMAGGDCGRYGMFVIIEYGVVIKLTFVSADTPTTGTVAHFSALKKW